MIFKVIAKEALPELFGLISRENKTVGPVRIAESNDGKPIHAFAPVSEFAQLDLSYTTTKLPAKHYFLPYTETLATYTFKNGDWTKRVDFNADEPVVLFGLHPCDINALNKLDKVLLKGAYPMPYYVAKRKNLFIVGMDCMPEPHCFCNSMGSDTAINGFDMFITDLGEKYFVEVLTNTAYNFLMQVRTEEPSDADHMTYKHRAEAKNAAFTTHVDTTDLTKILDLEFQSPVWEHWGNRCFSCGSCANVCPTCYCYGVEESVSIDLKSTQKTRRLYSCNLVDFAEVAGGHNFRPQGGVRLKYRYYHKHRGFVEAYEEPLCVGCGRCQLSCLAGISVPQVVASVRAEEIA